MYFPWFAQFLTAVLLLGLLPGILLLWLGTRLARMPHASLPRIVRTVVVICLFHLTLVVTATAISTALPSPWVATATVTVAAALMLIAPWLWIRWRFQAGAGQAALARCILLCGTAVVGLQLALVIGLIGAQPFVVPTGAMAPTIMGQHADFRCTNCGDRIAVGSSFLFAMANGVEFPETAAVRCPNCNHVASVSISDVAAATRSGDRVTANRLVRPQRWDVVVFRYPEDPSLNYVKRLVGLPGETIRIRDGDAFADGARLQKGPGQCPDLWLPVHDTAHTPRRRLPDTRYFRPSQSDNGWRQVGHPWRYEPRGGVAADLEFSQPVTDELAYNVTFGPPPAAPPPPTVVRDVKLACRVSNCAPGATLRLVREQGPWRWEATISAAGEVQLEAASRLDRTAEGKRDGPLLTRTVERGRLTQPPGDGRWLALAVRDGQAYVLEEGRLVVLLQFGSPDHDPAQMAVESSEPGGQRGNGGLGLGEGEPTEDGTPGRIAIGAAGGSITIEQIVLERDVYYLSPEELERRFGYPVATPDHLPYTLAADEYFFLGDNSAQSKDSRFWGGARRDALRGPVDCIYWPPDRWHQLR